MNEKQKNEIKEKFAALIKNIFHAKGTREPKHDYIGFHSITDKGSLKYGWDDQPFVDLIKAIQNLGLNVASGTISSVIKERVLDLARRSVENRITSEANIEIYYEDIEPLITRNHLDNIIDQILAMLRSEIKSYTVLIPLSGVVLKDLPTLNIGRFVLYPKGEGPLADTLAKFDNGTIKSSLEKISCYAVIKGIDSDWKFADQYALDQIRNVIHILNLYLTDWNIRLTGWHRIKEQPITTHYSLAIHTSSEDTGASRELLSYRDYEIDADEIKDWEKRGLDTVIKCFTEANLSGIEKRIKRAVTWYSKAVSADNDEEGFLALAIALESLLIGEEGKNINANWGSINQRLVDRVAFLLGKTYTNRLCRVSKESKKGIILKGCQNDTIIP